jgi:hypothetical protein
MENAIMKEKKITVGIDFTKTPIGRYRDDGPYSGQVFREDILIPALKEYDKVIIDLAGVEGYGSSFLEETFGGLVRSGDVDATLKDKLHIMSSDPAMSIYVDFAKSYMQAAIASRR